MKNKSLEEKLLSAFRNKNKAEMTALVAQIKAVSENKQTYLEYVLDHTASDIPPEKISHIANQIAPHLLEEKIRINHQDLIDSGYIVFLLKYHELWIQMLELKIRSYGKPEGDISPKSQKISPLFLFYSLIIRRDPLASISPAIERSPNYRCHYLFLKLVSIDWISQKRTSAIHEIVAGHLPIVLLEIVLSYCMHAPENIIENIEKELTVPEKKASEPPLFRSPLSPNSHRLSKSGSETSIIPNSNLPPLILAAKSGHSDVIQRLLENKADPTIYCHKKCVVMWAIECRHEEAAKILLNSIKPPAMKL